MKKILIIFLLTASLASFSQTQYGVRAGTNLSIIKIRTNAQHFTNSGSTRTSAFLGVYGMIKLTNTIYFNPEIIYSSEGVTDERLTYVNNYFDIPLFINFRVSEKTYLEFGSELGFLASNKVKFDGSKEDGGAFGSNQNISIGAGFKSFVSGRFGIGVRYMHGLNSISSDLVIVRVDRFTGDAFVVDRDPKSYSRNWQISILYNLRKG